MRVGYEGMQLVAVRGDDRIYGNIREIAECLFVSPSLVGNCFKEKRKCKGYMIFERWVWNYRLIDKKTKETVYECRTKQAMCDYLEINRWDLDKMLKYGSKNFYLAKEKKELWQE